MSKSSSPRSEPPPTCSFLVLCHTRDWSPLAFYHFLLINWVQESCLLWDSRWRICSQWLLGALRVCASLGLTAAALFATGEHTAVRAPSGGLLSWSIPSEGCCYPHLGNINHRLRDRRPLVMWTVMCGCLTLAQFTQFLSLHAASIGVASSVNLEVV